MKRYFCLATMILLGTLPTAARAGYSPEPDCFGVYFDTTAYSNFEYKPWFTPFSMYLVLQNPTAAFDGFECTVSTPATNLYTIATDLGPGAVDTDPSPTGYAVTAPADYPSIGNGVVLVAWQMIVSSSASVPIFVTEATHPSLPGGLPILTKGGVPRLGQVSNCDVTKRVAEVNPSGVPFYYGCADYPYTNISCTVTASAAGVTASAATASTRSNATDGRDATLDLPRSAPPAGAYVSACFEHPDWIGGPRFRTDVKSRFDFGATYRVWPLMVETNCVGEVSLSFQCDWDIPPLVRDLQTGQVYRPTTPSQTVTFTNDGQSRAYRFQLALGEPIDAAGIGDAQVDRPSLAAAPNPFNPRTTLDFVLPTAGRVHLAVYDVAGRLVRTLADEVLSSGRHEETWDGRDDAGREAGAGVYLARLEAGGGVATLRLALVR